MTLSFLELIHGVYWQIKNNNVDKVKFKNRNNIKFKNYLNKNVLP